ncbi:MAG: GspH/FimT family pseudopilin [Acidobacteriota bacterium]
MARWSSSAGLTFPELIVAVAIFTIATGIGLATVGAIVPSLRTDTQVGRLQGTLQFAREHAIAQRRDVELRVDADASVVSLVRHDGGVEAPVLELAFEYGVRFLQFSGLGDTPEGYGDQSAVDFGGSTQLLFTADGMLIDETGAPINGTFYLGMPDRIDTARAVAVTGSTARGRVYRWNDGWVSQ